MGRTQSPKRWSLYGRSKARNLAGSWYTVQRWWGGGGGVGGQHWCPSVTEIQGVEVPKGIVCECDGAAEGSGKTGFGGGDDRWRIR